MRVTFGRRSSLQSTATTVPTLIAPYGGHLVNLLVPDPQIEYLICNLNVSARTQDGPAAPSDAAEAEPPREAAAAAAPNRARWRLPVPTHEGSERLVAALARAREAQASDLYLVEGAPLTLRVNGRLAAEGTARLSGGEAALLCASLVPPARRAAAEAAGTLDFSLSVTALGRFRCNVHQQRGFWAAAVRLFPEGAPDLEALRLPAALGRFADLEQGLVLVTGPTGSGKSTTLAALARRILARRRVHLITIEDPVEYEHPHGESVVEHIEIGRDVPAFGPALRSALRQDPDVLLIGEMRDLESVSIAITAAETGHVVLSTLHTGDAPQTVNRILDLYPAGQIDAVRTQLSISLAGIVSQQLLPRRETAGRVPAVEILVATPAVRNLIRQNKIPQLRSQITLERGAGMLSLDRSLADLVRQGLVDAGEARARARTPAEFEMLLRQAD
jgi:twitching motility protein PilT